MSVASGLEGMESAEEKVREISIKVMTLKDDLQSAREEHQELLVRHTGLQAHNVTLNKRVRELNNLLLDAA